MNEVITGLDELSQPACLFEALADEDEEPCNLRLKDAQ